MLCPALVVGDLVRLNYSIPNGARSIFTSNGLVGSKMDTLCSAMLRDTTSQDPISHNLLQALLSPLNLTGHGVGDILTLRAQCD